MERFPHKTAILSIIRRFALGCYAETIPHSL